MVNFCNKCGEHTKVRKITNIGDGGVGYPHILIYEYSYICKKCEDATRIIERKYKEDYELENKKKRQDWIKMRDKLLFDEIIKKGKSIIEFEENLKELRKK